MAKFRRNYGSFSADLEEIATATDERLTALMRMSLQDVVNNAQQSAAKGGRMRVDTGFLRASGQASLTGMPTGPVRGDSKERHHYDDGSSSVEISIFDKMKLGMTFFFGWTANYAQYREIYDGFLEGALQHWGRIVAFNTDLLRERINK